jgi:hypothetical protein
MVRCADNANAAHPGVMKQGLVLDRVVLLGRTLDEYRRFFSLDLRSLRDRAILDVASGVSSFCAEARQCDLDVIACDLIYQLSREQIQARCEPDLDHVIRSVGPLKTYRWDFYKSPEGVRRYRERAYKTFLADYRLPRGTRYVAGELPKLPFAGGRFDLTLVSYLLFVYEDHLDYEFHKRSLLEIMRVTRGEARFYPLVTFEAKRCSYVDRLRSDPDLGGLAFEEVATDFEFLLHSNSYLCVRHRPA